MHDSSTYKFLDFSSPILFLIITAVTPTHVSLKHVLAHDPRARTARALKVEWPLPHYLEKRRARHVRLQPILSSGDNTGPISVALSYAASNPSYVIGDVLHLLRVGEVARALSSLVLSSSVSRPFCPCFRRSISSRRSPSFFSLSVSSCGAAVLLSRAREHEPESSEGEPRRT